MNARLDYIFGIFTDPDNVDIEVVLLRSDSKAPLSDHTGVVANIGWTGRNLRKFSDATTNLGSI